MAAEPAAHPDRDSDLVGVLDPAFTQARARTGVMNVSEVRIPHARVIAMFVALIACAAIFWLARSFTFYFDEWTFILTSPDWTWSTILEPHNVHPSMLPRLIYAA